MKKPKLITIAKSRIYWVIVGQNYRGNKHFSTDLRALEFAESIWPGCEVVYA